MDDRPPQFFAEFPGPDGGPPADPDRPGRMPDAGSRRAGLIALVVAVPILALVVFLQQAQVRLGASAIQEQARTEIVPPSPGDGFTLISQIMVKGATLLESMGAPGTQVQEMLGSVDDAARSPSEVMRAAMVAGQLAGDEQALRRLERAQELIERSLASTNGLTDEAAEALRADIESLRRLYTGATLTPDERDRLAAHHGWFARLALIDDATDAERAAVLGGGGALLALLAGFGALIVLAFLLGFVALLVLVVKVASGRLRTQFRPPAVGGSVHLETFVAFVTGFLLLQMLGAGLAAVLSADAAMIAGLLLQWCLLPLALWPVFRGVPMRVWREQVGLVAPRGVWREIGAGIVMYLAGVPVYVAAALATVLLILLRDLVLGGAAGTPSAGPPLGPSGPINPVIELIAGKGLTGTLLIGSLVVLWAPLVEELVFRGALYRHMRARLHWVASAVLSAALFGLLHQYDVLMLLPVITLGAVFAATREWRGSLIGCVTGHMLHNGTIFCLVLTLVSLMG
ncbi:MAG: lysostaphin resistance A-like protein [Phycisphaerales bacterium]